MLKQDISRRAAYNLSKNILFDAAVDQPYPTQSQLVRAQTHLSAQKLTQKHTHCSYYEVKTAQNRQKNDIDNETQRKKRYEIQRHLKKQLRQKKQLDSGSSLQLVSIVSDFDQSCLLYFTWVINIPQATVVRNFQNIYIYLSETNITQHTQNTAAVHTNFNVNKVICICFW